MHKDVNKMQFNVPVRTYSMQLTCFVESCFVPVHMICGFGKSLCQPPKLQGFGRYVLGTYCNPWKSRMLTRAHY